MNINDVSNSQVETMAVTVHQETVQLRFNGLVRGAIVSHDHKNISSFDTKNRNQKLDEIYVFICIKISVVLEWLKRKETASETRLVRFREGVKNSNVVHSPADHP